MCSGVFSSLCLGLVYDLKLCSPSSTAIVCAAAAVVVIVFATAVVVVLIGFAVDAVVVIRVLT